MNNFEFQSTTKIIFGKETHKEVGKRVKPYADKVLLHYGGGSIKRNGVYDDVMKALKAENIEVFELGGVKANPELALVNEGIDICRKESIKFILAVGGGSAIDSAKAIAAGTNYSGDVWDFYTGKVKVMPTFLKIATVLTIPAAGSESSSGTVLTKEDGLLKYSFGSSELFPIFSILNPEICFTLPAEQVVNGISDMIAHVFERYFTNTQNTELTDSLSEALIKTVMNNARRVKRNMSDYEAWAQIMWSGTLAHNGLLDTGRSSDWGSHGIEHELSALYDIAHGAGLSIIFPAWIKYVYKDNIDMFVQFAINIFGVNPNLRDRDAIVQEGILALERFYVEMGLPIRLSDVGIGSDDFDLMAKKATLFGTLGSLKVLGTSDVKNIFELAL